ncbi:MAG: hypothetical protein AB3N23_00070 [Paracoccaceae bacterium]
MKVRTRFIRSVIKSAEAETTRMPWTRGVIRDVNKMTRRGELALPKVRTA